MMGTLLKIIVPKTAADMKYLAELDAKGELAHGGNDMNSIALDQKGPIVKDLAKRQLVNLYPRENF